MLNQYFIKQAIKEIEIEKFIRDNFPMGDYSKIEMQRTPMGIKILIHTNKPGRIIGRSGRNINEMTDAIRGRFGLENPQLDVKIIRNPDLDARIVAKQIASSREGLQLQEDWEPHDKEGNGSRGGRRGNNNLGQVRDGEGHDLQVRGGLPEALRPAREGSCGLRLRGSNHEAREDRHPGQDNEIFHGY
jgi:predicted RNA-binding protein YlqC (UPF0109 family)